MKIQEVILLEEAQDSFCTAEQVLVLLEKQEVSLIILILNTCSIEKKKIIAFKLSVTLL